MEGIKFQREEIRCDKCGKKNTEFITFTHEVDLDDVYERITFKPTTYLKQVVLRYIRRLLDSPLEQEVNICQTCVSKGFRSFRKDY